MTPCIQDAGLPDAPIVLLDGNLPPALPVASTHAEGKHIPRHDVEATSLPDNAIAVALTRHAHAARGACAANTERALRADTAVFTGWCAAAGLASLPAEPGTVGAFIDAMGDVKASATVRRYVGSIAAGRLVRPRPDLTRHPAISTSGTAERQMRGRCVWRWLMAIGTAVQKHGFVYVYDEKGRQVSVIAGR